MKLWPFSKKSEAPTDYERKFELPPGVMLAAPDEEDAPQEAATTTPGRYEAMHAEEIAPPSEAHSAPPAPAEVNEATPDATPELKPDLQQFFEQNQLAFVSQTQPVEPSTAQPQGEPPASKDAIYQEINQSLTAMANTEPAVEAPLFNPLDTATTPNMAPPTDPSNVLTNVLDFGLGESTNQESPLAAQEQPIDAPDRQAPSLPVTDEADDAFLFMPEGSQPKSHLSESHSGEPFNLEMLVPPPFNPTEPFDSVPAISSSSSPEPVADLFYPTVDTPLTGTDASLPLCDLSSSFLEDAPVPSPPEVTPDDMSAFFPVEEAPSLSALEGEPQNAQALLDELLKSPEFHQAEESHSAPASSDSVAAPEPAYPTPAEAEEPTTATDLFTDTSFAASSFVSSFASMDGFDDFACPDSLFNTPEAATTEASYLEMASVTGPEIGYAALPDESPDATSAQSSDESWSEDGYSYSDEDMPGDAELNSEVSSYDYGHYDDPDEPASIIALDDEPLYESAHQPAYQSAQPEEAEPDLDALMASLTQARTPECPETHAFEAAAAAPPEPPAPLGSVFEQPVAEPVSQPFQQHPAEFPATAQNAAQPSSKPEPLPLQAPGKEEARPASRQTPASKPSPRPKYYTESIAEALESFEEEVMLQDSRFLRNSINNLVDRYFAQQESEGLG